MNGRFRMLGEEGMATFDVSIEAGMLSRSPVDEASDRLLVPGFVDIHIHGAFGIDFMSASPDQMVEMADRLGEVGYEAFFPTTVSASPEAVAAALRNLPKDSRMPGVHLEGPFISPQYPGAQPPEAIRDFEGPTGAWRPILNDPRLNVMTLAPERDAARSLIEDFARRGGVVSMGHTNATYAEAEQGYRWGVRHATHTFNAMRGLHHREAGALGFALLEDGIACELIYDRLHVSKEAAALLFRCKPKDKVIAVSDGTMASGLASGEKLSMWGHDVETRGGGVYLAGTDTLAGSAITLLDAFRNLAEDFGEETAIRACCLNPRSASSIGTEPRVWLEFDPHLSIVQIHRTG
ncbi:MAG TPA: amidohydrolase family protein [Fimbriimonadaceae bacterium]|nr:amidohydrolase family protein [Fimbriimonadaceae bacterium]